MKTSALVPLKPPEQAKTRLAGSLSVRDRALLVRAMARHVKSVLAATKVLEHVFVLTAHYHDVPRGAIWLPDRWDEFNQSIAGGIDQICRLTTTDRIVVIAGDLPYLEGDDILAVLAVAPKRGVAIATNEQGVGTNALVLSPPTVIKPCFGENSLFAHKAAAHAAGVNVEIVQRPGLAKDIDTPEDLAQWQSNSS